MLRRAEVETAVADHYSAKMNGRVWCSYDDSKRAYCIQGSKLPAHPDMQAQYPNGWEMLDYVKSAKAQEIAREYYNVRN